MTDNNYVQQSYSRISQAGVKLQDIKKYGLKSMQAGRNGGMQIGEIEPINIFEVEQKRTKPYEIQVSRPKEFDQKDTQHGSPDLEEALKKLEQKYNQEQLAQELKPVKDISHSVWSLISKNQKIKSSFVPTLFTEAESREWLKKEDETPLEETIEATKLKMLKQVLGLQDNQSSVFESNACHRLEWGKNDSGMTKRWRNIDTTYVKGIYFIIIDDCVEIQNGDRQFRYQSSLIIKTYNPETRLSEEVFNQKLVTATTSKPVFMNSVQFGRYVYYLTLN